MAQSVLEVNTRLGQAMLDIVGETYAKPPRSLTIMKELVEDPSQVHKEILIAKYLHMTPWIRNFPRWLGLIYGNCPENKVRRILLDDMVDEDMVDKRAGDSHPGLHMRLWKALGRDLQELDDYEKDPIPEASLVNSSEYEAARHWPWLEGLAAVGISEIFALNPNQPGKGWNNTMSAMVQQYVSYDDAAFAWVHESADIGHAGGHVRALEEFTPPDQEEKVIRAARTGMKWFWTLAEAVGREMDKARDGVKSN
jgi:pyrroloquinoline quinone (PQQ) biosynthesis protein C